MDEGAAYMDVMRAMRLYPNSSEFVYLSRLDADPTDYNPYALVIRPTNGWIRGITTR